MSSYATPAAPTEDENMFAWCDMLPAYCSMEIVPLAAEFRLFSMLAPELRFQIWDCALQESETAHRTWNNAKFSYSLRRRVPPVLQVCKETRDWFIQEPWVAEVPKGRYQLVRLRERQNGGVYLDWAKDRVHIYRGSRSAVGYTTV